MEPAPSCSAATPAFLTSLSTVSPKSVPGDPRNIYLRAEQKRQRVFKVKCPECFKTNHAPNHRGQEDDRQGRCSRALSIR